jgi:hypothetical protein
MPGFSSLLGLPRSGDHAPRPRRRSDLAEYDSARTWGSCFSLGADLSIAAGRHQQFSSRCAVSNIGEGVLTVSGVNLVEPTPVNSAKPTTVPAFRQERLAPLTLPLLQPRRQCSSEHGNQRQCGRQPSNRRLVRDRRSTDRTVTPSSLSFPSQVIETSSSLLGVTVNNTSSKAVLTVSGVSVTGADASEFSQINNCSTLQPGADTIGVAFLGMAAYGGGGSPPPPTMAGTPAGTYSATVTAKSGSTQPQHHTHGRGAVEVRNDSMRRSPPKYELVVPFRRRGQPTGQVAAV